MTYHKMISRLTDNEKLAVAADSGKRTSMAMKSVQMVKAGYPREYAVNMVRNGAKNTG